jgi:low affinity Fe/Cu permease
MFGRVAQWTADKTASAGAFCLALGVIVLWALCGPVFGFSDTWQLIINTGTTIITFLMVFLLQYSQARDTAAIHAKLDGLIAGCDRTSNRLLDLEHADRDTVERVKQEIVDESSP